MTPTEIALLALHKAPMIRLADICEHYFDMSYPVASRKARRDELPVPCWRAVDSRKAPILIHFRDLAKYVDERASAESEEWARARK